MTSRAPAAPVPLRGRPGVAPSAACVVRVEALVKRFPRRRSWREMLAAPLERLPPTTVIDEVGFEVRSGEFFGLLGPNGAGKTTLFKILGAQLLPDEGRAEVAGFDVTKDAAAVRRVLAPVVAEERSLYWRLSAPQNLELFAALQGCPRAEVAARVRSLLATVELEEAGDRMVGTFSSGMKQRLLIARALIGRPRVLLLDEPTRSLDPLSARRFRAFLREEIIGRQECTVLLATHNAEEAFELCDRVAVLDRGRLLTVGPLRELMDRVSDHAYRVTVRASQRDRLVDVARTALGADARTLEDPETAGWTTVELRIPRGAGHAARVLTRLTAGGLEISRFERMELTLAELLERVVATRGDGSRA